MGKIKQINLKKFFKAIFFFAFIIAGSCLTIVKNPREFIPDDKLVYLKQPYYLTPIKYYPEKTKPYSWDVKVEIDKVNPTILSFTDFNKMLAPDLLQDVKIFREIKEHLLFMSEDPLYKGMKEKLNNFNFQASLYRTIQKGDKVNEYSNAEEYSYQPDKDNDHYFKYNDEIKINNDKGELIKFIKPNPQYSFKPAGKKYKYIFFVDDFEKENINSIALIHDNLLRYDYVVSKDAIMINNKEVEAIVITNDFIKTYQFFNVKTRKAEDIYSYYFPEGIRVIDVNKTLTYSSVNPGWPENYLEKKMGPFKILYTKKDERLLNKINIQKLNELYITVKKTTGINFPEDRIIILPPDLKSYSKLHTFEKEEILKWYPSGFEIKDTIVMWPPSVKRYEGEEGEKYFWDKEFYEISIHELTHLIEGEVTGVFSEIPVWLDERPGFIY